MANFENLADNKKIIESKETTTLFDKLTNALMNKYLFAFHHPGGKCPTTQEMSN